MSPPLITQKCAKSDKILTRLVIIHGLMSLN
ncbi:UNVERIFIED_CONTAM: hypothetical protein GTU68_023409 [Idotea baltica]|nr:hypothetical protein [Idotea baltica]